MKKRMIAGLMAVLMTMSLAACGSSAGSSDASGTGSAATGDNSAAQAASGDKVTLSLCWWGNQTRNDVTKKAVDLYMEQNPNVEIKVEFTDWSGYRRQPSRYYPDGLLLSATVSAERPAC